MTVQNVKQQIESGRDAYEQLPIPGVCDDWERLGSDIELTQRGLYDAIDATRVASTHIASMLEPLAVAHIQAEQAQRSLEATGDGTGNTDLLDLLTTAHMITQDTHKLEDTATILDTHASQLNHHLASAMIALGKLVAAYEQVNADQVIPNLRSAQTQAVDYAAQYLAEH